jgi:GTPase
MHKAGFVNILGNPNVGKSTLMNALVGEKISIITSKSQTTRHRILGIVNAEEYQIVYSDTPGILKPAYQLQNAMMKYVRTAISDADVIVYMTDPRESPLKNQEILDKIRRSDPVKILVMNKSDQLSEDSWQQKKKEWQEHFPEAAEYITLCALKKQNLEALLNFIIKHLPESPPYFPKDQLTDRHERFFTAEIIREKILRHYKKEIPYSVEIEIESFKDEKDITRIRALIHVLRDSQKGILIGHKGERLKKVGTEARKEMEAFLGRKVFLELYVKVNKDWRDRQKQLKRFGY